MELSDAQWNRIKDALPGKECDSGRTVGDNRLFVEAVLWVGRNGGVGVFYRSNTVNGIQYTSGLYVGQEKVSGRWSLIHLLPVQIPSG